MAIRLTDDDEDYNRPSNNTNNNTNNNNSNNSDNNNSNNNGSSLSNFNFSASDKKTAGIVALVGVVLFGLFKFPKFTIFVLLVAGAVLYYMYGDQELLRKWGIKE
jgi:hypothetical protein